MEGREESGRELAVGGTLVGEWEGELLGKAWVWLPQSGILSKESVAFAAIENKA